MSMSFTGIRNRTRQLIRNTKKIEEQSQSSIAVITMIEVRLSVA